MSNKKLLIILISGVLSVSQVACGRNSDESAIQNSMSSGNLESKSSNKTTETHQNQKIDVTRSDESQKQKPRLPDFVSLVKEVGNSVVNITAESKKAAMGYDNEMDPFAELFKRFGPQFQMPEPALPRRPQSQIRKSMGSGFIISKDGYILTNAHVVKDATKIVVKTTRREEFEAKLVGIDLKTDIALIKVSVNNLPAVKIGNPSSLDVGEWVAAIGAPFGFDNSVTQGIVSAKDRSLPNDSYVPFIQTDVPINPGNSGGPLFNLNGEVVGMNSQIYSRSGGYMGISFSIPIDIAINISNQLKLYGKAVHGGMGVRVQSVTKQLAQSFGLAKATGALVSQVVIGSGAEKAGIKAGDIIIKADGKEIDDATQLPIIVGSAKPGYEMPIVLLRSGHELNVKVKLSDLSLQTNDEDNEEDDSSNSKNRNRSPSPDMLILDQFGLAVKNLDAAAKSRGIHGVLVTGSQSIAASAGIMPNDIILKVNNSDVDSIAQVKPLIAGKKTIALLVLRGDQQMFITLSIG